MSPPNSGPAPPGVGPPEFPSGPGPHTFRCVLTALSPAAADELGQIFLSHGEEVLKLGAVAFEVKTSADGRYLQIEETYDGMNAQTDFNRVHSKDGTHWWHEHVSVLQEGINAAFWQPVKREGLRKIQEYQ